MRTQWPLTGRDDVLSSLVRLVSSSGLLLTGPAGVGKTRLASELTAVVAAEGTPTHRVTASPTATAVPFAALSALVGDAPPRLAVADRKSTRLNSSHSSISYAVFCL